MTNPKYTAANDNNPARARHAMEDNLATTTFGPLEIYKPQLIYLGSPYSLYEGGHQVAANLAARAAALLMECGHIVYAPIPHGHAISGTYDLPQTWDFWKRQCQPFIDAAAALVVLKLGGWQESVGLTYEIEEFTRAGKPVVYVTLSELEAARKEAA